MIALSLDEIVALTGGAIQGPGPAAGSLLVDGPVVTDSREAGPGSLYVARIGEHADGHRFVGPARDNGAVAALTSRAVEELPCVVVDDVQEALATLARGVVDRCRTSSELQIIGITGSSGKTGTKDLLAHVLSGHGQTIAPAGSLNSEVGVPLTVCRLTDSTRYLVAEMGASGVGHVAYLTRIAPPDIGIVLNVGTAHLGGFGSREAIARTKAELVEALPDDGVAILNADDPVVAAMATQAAARVVLVGTDPRAQVRAQGLRLNPEGQPSFALHTPAGTEQVALQLHGEHQVGNALAVAATALELGMTLPRVAAALSGARPVSRWRMEVHQRPDGVTVVNDAYNANPESMAAALRALVAIGAGRRTWAVLGEMLELGEDAAADHEAVGVLAAELGVDVLLGVGPAALPMRAGFDDALRSRAGVEAHALWAADADRAQALLEEGLRAGDVVLLKSSRDAGLRHLGDRLVGAGQGAAC